MEDQFLSVAARHKRLPQTTALSSPLIGTDKGSRCQEGIRTRPGDYARRRPVKDHVAPGRFLLIAGEDGHAWCEAARQLAAEAGVPLDALRIGHLDGDYHDPRCAWQRLRQIARDGAIVVRPDRSSPGDPRPPPATPGPSSPPRSARSWPGRSARRPRQPPDTAIPGFRGDSPASPRATAAGAVSRGERLLRRTPRLRPGFPGP
jgi:hypothetical protein